jgi:phospholipid/cholesterol/gamma-HCH transport system substrate-binding protein
MTMLAYIQRGTAREHNKLLVAGVCYVAAMLILMGLCTAAYLKYFQSVVWVTVQADRAGLQLPVYGDVRMHGVLIGQVRQIRQENGKAMIKLGLDPEAAKSVPTNADVQIKPTTLFGQKYVEFVDPASVSARGLDDGTVIASDRVRTSVELDNILARLSTILTTVQPEDLNASLHAVATALSGNGNDIGEAMVKLDRYLGTMNSYLPTLKTDLQQLAKVSRTYSVAAPDLIATLKNATKTAKTVKAKDDDFHDLLAGVSDVADNGTTLLRDNEKAINVESQLAVPLLKLTSLYAPEFPCLLQTLTDSIPNLNQVFHKSRVNQTMSFAGTQRPSYKKIDRPQWNDWDRGPNCYGLPDKYLIGKPKIKDGTEDDPAQFFNQGIGDPAKYFTPPPRTSR